MFVSFTTDLQSEDSSMSTSGGGGGGGLASTLMSTLNDTLAAAASTEATVSQANTTPSSGMNSTVPPIHTNSAWLTSASAQGIAGVFVWAAIIITCHQVNHSLPILFHLIAAAFEMIFFLNCRFTNT
jgi:hypothetical protein